MLPRIFFKSRDTFFVAFVTFIITISAVYLYNNHLHEQYKSAQWSGGRCLSELTSVKYQLNVVTEYKNKIDKLLTETQKLHESDMDKFKDIMESCVAMKQQAVICQSQFEDLQSECKKVREDYDKVIKESGKIKVITYLYVFVAL